MAAESDPTSQRLPHVAGPKVDAVGRQAHHREHQVGTERHRLHRNTMKSGFFFPSHFTLFTADLLSDLLAVVAVENQEVLLKRQLLLPIS